MTKTFEKVTSNYMKPTPKKWRKLGDSLLAMSLFVTSTAAYNDIEWMIYTSAAIGIIGKFLTNFFSEE
jgi:ABC-type phosphate/phosphonate transport system permease subunit